MRTCPKCSKQASDESKICRDCGSILDDIPDDSVPVATVQPEASVESGLPLVAEPQEAELKNGDRQSVGEVVVGSDEPAPLDAETPAWKCPQCDETVPGTFDVCWKCLTTKDGEKPKQDSEFLRQIAEASEDNTEDEPTDQYAEALGMGHEEQQQPPRAECPRCGSPKIMHGVTVSDQGEYSDGRLKVVVFGDPSALVFKDRLYGELRADICGDCGHVELRVANPEKLYGHYRKTLG